MSNPVVLLYFGSKRVDFLNIAYFQLVSYPYRPPNYQNLRNLKKPQPKQSISCPYLSGHLKLERITSLTPISTQPTKKSPPLHPDRRRRRRRSIPRWPRSRRSASTSSPPAARRQAPPSPGTPQLPPTQLTPAAASVGFDSIGSRDSATAVCSVFFFHCRSEVHRDGDYHRAVHVWIYSESTGELLLQRRADCKDSWPGQWDISSAGHISAGDSSLSSAQ